MKLLTQPGDTLTEGFGPDLTAPTLLVTMTRERNGIAFHVTDGVQRIAELCKTFTVREHAVGFYRLLRDTANAGKRIYQIAAEAAALVEMMGIDTARTEQQIADALNAEINADYAEVIAVHNATVAIVDEVMATADYATWRAEVRRQAVAEATSTVTRAQNVPAPLDRIVAEAAANGGVIVRSGLAKSTQIIALMGDGLAVPTYELAWKRGRSERRISGAHLTEKGLKRAAELNGVVA